MFNFFSKVVPKLTEDLSKPFKLEGVQRIDETPIHKAIREAFVNLIIHSDYLVDSGTLKIIKRNKSIEFTNPGILKLPIEDIFSGGNSKTRNPHLQIMFRMVGFGDNAGSGFPTIVSVWESQGWKKPILIENTVLNQVTLKLEMVSEKGVDEEITTMPKSAEDEEMSAEDGKMSAEDEEISAEDEKNSAEDGEMSAEDEEMSAEDDGNSAEDEKNSAEDGEMTDQEKVIYDYVVENEMITSAIVSDILNIKERRSRDILSEMCKKKYLKKQGVTANLKYVLNDIVD